jgi:hypothetical protein
MYGFWVDNTYLTGSSGHFFTGSCNCSDSMICASADLECLRESDFTAYDSTTCDVATCADKGCIRDGTCQTCTGSFTFCHLCFDRECNDCTDYAAGSCTECLANSTEGSGACTCNAGFARLGNDTQLPCLACHTSCSTCTTGGITNYSDCTACDGTASGQGILIHGSIYYCTEFCPTGQTHSAGVCTGTLGAVFGATFNDFSSSWSTSSVTLTAQGTYPAKERGNYFQGSGSSDRMEFNNFYLNVHFTVSAWIRLDAVGT